MKIKKEYYILTGLVLLLSLYLVFHNTGKINYTLPTLKTLSTNDIINLSITGTDASINLDKEKTGWRLKPDNYKVNKTLMDTLVETTAKANVIDLVSKTKNYKIYGLDNKKGIHVVAKGKNGTVLRDFIIGTQTTGGDFTYVKLKNDKNVYTMKGRVRNKFEITADKIKDKKVLSFMTGDIQKITIRGDGVNLSFVRENKDKKPVWKTSGGKSIDTKKINDYLNELSLVNFDTFTTKKLPSAAVTITLSDKKGLHTLAISRKIGNAYIGTSSYSDRTFLLKGEIGDAINKNIDNLKKELNKK